MVGLGASCLDFIGVVPKFPKLDEEIEMLESTYQGGGEVATALVTLAKLGASVSYIGKIGDDAIGRIIKQEFDHYSVDTSHMIVEQDSYSLASMVMVDRVTGKRTILAGKSTVSDLKFCEIKPGIIKKAKYLHLDGNFRKAALEAARRAKNAGVTIVFDADVLAYDPTVHTLIELTDILIASENFAQSFTGKDNPEEAIKIMRSYGPYIVAITLGEKGCFCHANEDNFFHTDSFNVDVKDTTGAGDVFHGAFIYGMLKEWSIEKVTEFASAVAAIKCKELGGRHGIPTFQNAITFLKNHNSKFFS